MTNPLVIYHGGGCFDGFCCAWLFHLAFPEADFVAAQYDQPPPDVAGRDVLMADFSYGRDVLLEMNAKAKSLVVLDHHKTAEEALRGLSFCTFDMTKSGGRMVWEWLWEKQLLPPKYIGAPFGPYHAPWLVHYTEDRDLWKWELPLSREINAALRSHPMDFGLWDTMAFWQYHIRLIQGHARVSDPGFDLHKFADDGRAILRAEAQVVAQHVKNAREIEIAGHKVLAANATTQFSEIAGELAKDRPFGACYFDRGDGQRVWSLRSREGGVDVSQIAKMFGGGGHKQAAGFQQPLPLLPPVPL